MASADKSISADTQRTCRSKTGMPPADVSVHHMSCDDRTTFLAGKDSNASTTFFSLPASSPGPRRTCFTCRQGAQRPSRTRTACPQGTPVNQRTRPACGQAKRVPGGRPVLAGKQNESPGDVRCLPASRMGPRGMFATCPQAEWVPDGSCYLPASRTGAGALLSVWQSACGSKSSLRNASP
jgi:hypothetical protein